MPFGTFSLRVRVVSDFYYTLQAMTGCFSLPLMVALAHGGSCSGKVRFGLSLYVNCHEIEKRGNCLRGEVAYYSMLNMHTHT